MNRLVDLLFGLSAFFFSLSLFSLRATIIAYVILAALIAINFRHFIRIKQRTWRVSAVLFGIFLLTAALSIRHEIYTNYFIKAGLIFGYCIAIFTLFSQKALSQRSYQNGLAILIYLHSIFLTIQVVVYLSTGTIIDLNNYVREVDSESLYFTKALEGSYLDIRAGGLFSEPSFYAMAVVPPAALLLAVQEKMTAPVIVAFATAGISMSIAAMLIVSCILAMHILRGKVSFISAFSILILALIALPIATSVFEKRVIEGVDYDAIESRTAIFVELRNRPAFDNIVGSGFYWDERYPQGTTGLWGYEIRDSSFFVYLFYCAGVIGCGVGLLLIIVATRNHLSTLAYFAPVLLFKFHILSGILLLYIVLLLVAQKDILSSAQAPKNLCRGN